MDIFLGFIGFGLAILGLVGLGWYMVVKMDTWMNDQYLGKPGSAQELHEEIEFIKKQSSKFFNALDARIKKLEKTDDN